uniref:Glutathione S-transferase 1-like n=1 Tax=Diabrotica virgifera virgifera TaxID=50390 RepID=A0A6P7H036_DIAVI
MPLLYMIDGSPPCRAVQLLAQELSIPLTLKNVNIPAKEQFAPEFLKKRVFYEQKRDVVPEDLAALVEAYEIVEKFLDSNQYVAGDKLTVADFSFWTSLTTWNGIGVYTEDKYPRIAAWLNRMSELPYSKINKEAVDSFKGYFLQLTGQAQ